MWWYTRLQARDSLVTRAVCRAARGAYWIVHVLLGRRRFSLAAADFLRSAYRDRPVPLDAVLDAAGHFTHTSDALLAHPSARVATGAQLAIESLRPLLMDRELGIWTLSVDVIHWLHAWVMRHRPARILEFGSGVSTLVLADALSRAAPDLPRPAIVSFEADERCADDTRALLQRAGLAEWARVHVVPVGPIEDSTDTCYQVRAAGLETQLTAAYDLVLIDGPASSRRMTLPLARSLMTRSAVFMLDDALRDAELADLRAWRDEPGVEIEGVYLMGKGLAIGRAAGRAVDE